MWPEILTLKPTKHHKPHLGTQVSQKMWTISYSSVPFCLRLFLAYGNVSYLPVRWTATFRFECAKPIICRQTKETMVPTLKKAILCDNTLATRCANSDGLILAC